MQRISRTQTGASDSGPAPTTASDTDAFEDGQAVVILSDDGEVDHISKAARKVLDLRSGPFTGVNFFHRVPPEHAFRIRRLLVELGDEERGTISGLLQLKTGLGPWQWFKVEATPRRRYDTEDGIVLRLFERGSAAKQH